MSKACMVLYLENKERIARFGASLVWPQCGWPSRALFDLCFSPKCYRSRLPLSSLSARHCWPRDRAHASQFHPRPFFNCSIIAAAAAAAAPGYCCGKLASRLTSPAHNNNLMLTAACCTARRHAQNSINLFSRNIRMTAGDYALITIEYNTVGLKWSLTMYAAEEFKQPKRMSNKKWGPMGLKPIR